MIKGKREGQKSLNAVEEQGDKNSEGPQQASGFKIQSIQQVDFPQNDMTGNRCSLKRSAIQELIISCRSGDLGFSV